MNFDFLGCGRGFSSSERRKHRIRGESKESGVEYEEVSWKLREINEGENDAWKSFYTINIAGDRPC